MTGNPQGGKMQIKTSKLTEAQKIIRIEVQQLPPAECSPNSRVHWSVRKIAADTFEAEVGVLATQIRNKDPRLFPYEKATVSLKLVVVDRRRRDLDNFWARFKSGMDALVRAGILADDDMEHLQHGEITVVVNATIAPMTIITITGRE
jgi:Holliday junction resolvase RusA-like endonuclease